MIKNINWGNNLPIMKQIKFLKKPWQIPVFVLITIYGIYRYGFLDFRVILLSLVTLFFIFLEVRVRKNKTKIKFKI